MLLLGSLHSFCYEVENWPIRKLGKHSTVRKAVYKRTKESKIREGDLVTYVKSRPKIEDFSWTILSTYSDINYC